MVDQNKIIIMTKLALYEKKYMRRDKRKLDYYIEDYVYLNNFGARLGITLITLFNIVVGAFKVVNQNIIFPTSIESFMDVYLRPYIMPWLLMIIAYTILSTIVSGAEYRKASSRFKEYKKLMKELDEYDNHQPNNEGAADEI